MKRDFDLAIIGAGIIGTCAAWYARKRNPQWRIALIDQKEVGSGATAYSASLDIPFGHTTLRYKLAKESRLLYAELRNEIPELPIKDLLFYGIVSKENAEVTLKQCTDKNAKLNPHVISSLKKNYPLLVLPENTTVITGASASQAITNEVTNTIAQNFLASPHSLILNHTKIIHVQPCEDEYNLQAADETLFSARRIIQATGPWMTNILGEHLLPVEKFRIKKIVAFHIHQQPKSGDPLFYFFDDDAFLMPKYEEGYKLFSFKCNHWDVVPDIATLSINDTDKQTAQDILQKYFPQYAPLCTTGRVFCDTYSSNGDPIIEQVKDHANYIIAGAGGGSGYRLAPAIANEALNLLS